MNCLRAWNPRKMVESNHHIPTDIHNEYYFVKDKSGNLITFPQIITYSFSHGSFRSKLLWIGGTIPTQHSPKWRRLQAFRTTRSLHRWVVSQAVPSAVSQFRNVWRVFRRAILQSNSREIPTLKGDCHWKTHQTKVGDFPVLGFPRARCADKRLWWRARMCHSQIMPMAIKAINNIYGCHGNKYGDTTNIHQQYDMCICLKFRVRLHPNTAILGKEMMINQWISGNPTIGQTPAGTPSQKQQDLGMGD